jgi:hypothetical protein
MMTFPSSTDLLVMAMSLVVLMICQWLVSGVRLSNRRGQMPQSGSTKSSLKFGRSDTKNRIKTASLFRDTGKLTA